MTDEPRPGSLALHGHRQRRERVVEAVANEERKSKGDVDAIELVGCDFRYLLHGDESYSYHGLMFAGDKVTISTRVLDFYEKKGGAMEFVEFESTISHSERGALVRAKRTLLHRLA